MGYVLGWEIRGRYSVWSLIVKQCSCHRMMMDECSKQMHLPSTWPLFLVLDLYSSSVTGYIVTQTKQTTAWYRLFWRVSTVLDTWKWWPSKSKSYKHRVWWGFWASWASLDPFPNLGSLIAIDPGCLTVIGSHHLLLYIFVCLICGFILIPSNIFHSWKVEIQGCI